MESNLINELQMILDTKGKDARPAIKRVLLKEYLHAYLLDFIYNNNDYSKLIFYGGTCLRYFYGLDRFSEDLDFDGSELESTDGLVRDLLKYFKDKIGYTDVTIRKQFGERGIGRFTVKFPVLYQLGLSPLEREKLFVKVEISNHKQHADIEKNVTSLYGRSLIAKHFSLESLFAGKILACLEREFKKGVDNIPIKGRDFYDLLWYMQKQVRPKEEILLKDGDKSYTIKEAFGALTKKIETIKPNDIYIDIIGLVENAVYAEKWAESFKERYFRLVKNYT
jgi:predicted nucleotidyltransferase component of viral defense system